jgi:hypothetical protein
VADRYCIVVTGSRRLQLEKHGQSIRAALAKHLPLQASHVVLIHGDQEGADRIAEHEFRSLTAACKRYRRVDSLGIPFFGDRGRAGGRHRNRVLAILSNALQLYGDYVTVGLAFPDAASVGTHICKKMLHEHHIVNVEEYPQ